MANRKQPTYRVASNPVRQATGGLIVLFAGESQTPPGHRVGPKVVDYYLLHHVISGKGRFMDGDRETELSAGQAFLIRPGQLAGYAADEADPWKYRWVAFAGEEAEKWLAEAGLTPPRSVADTGASRVPERCLRAIFEAFRARRPSAPLEAAGHLLLLLAALREDAGGVEGFAARPASHQAELVRRAIDFMAAQLAEPVTMEGMAEALGYSRAHLSRAFKKETGLTPVAFLNRLRLDRGRRLLRERPELTVAQIALSVGFRDALYFTKRFRRMYGETPTAYRLKTAPEARSTVSPGKRPPAASSVRTPAPSAARPPGGH